MIKHLTLIVTLLLAGCAASEPETVSFDIPFSGALTSDSQVVAVDGSPFSVGSPVGALSLKSQFVGAKTFSCFDNQGENVGRVDYGEGMISRQTTDGDQILFTMPVCFHMNNEDEVCAENMQFIEFPCGPGINVCPSDTQCRRGAAAGTITSGVGSFRASVGQRTIEHRYAMCVTGDGPADRDIQSVSLSIVLLNR